GSLPVAAREQASQRVQSDGFAEQVRVRGKVKRQVRGEVEAVMIKRLEKAPAKVVLETAAHEVINPEPGERAESDFERAGPVDAAMEGVLLDPALDLAADLIEAVGAAHLGEHDQVLMAVELPDDLVIPGARGVEV